jgi:DNA-binding LytR/AlgR family response regulator
MTQVLRVMVVDDEPAARRRLIRMLGDIADVEVVAEAQDGEEAVVRASLQAVDVMFLDIQMPGLNGITLAQRSVHLPSIIFCTAHHEHALEAFEVNAVDYLLKPVRPERLAQAVGKVRLHLGSGQLAMLERLAAPSSERVLSMARGVVKFFNVSEVNRFWASEKYTVFMADNAEQLTEESLVSLEQRLGPDFFRVHRSELVRLSAIKSLSQDNDGHLVALRDGEFVRVSRRSLTALRRALAINRGE